MRVGLWGWTRRGLRWTRRLLLALLLPLLLLAAMTQWWLLPRLNDYRADLAAALGETLHLPVRIDAVSGARDGWRLGLRLRGVSLDDIERDVTLARFSQVVVTLNLWRSLWAWRPVVGRIRIEGAALTLEEDADGRLRLRTATDGGEAAASLAAVGSALLQLPHVDIVGERLVLHQRDGRILQLLHPYLRWEATATGQRLSGAAEWPIEDAATLHVHLNLERRAGLGQPLNHGWSLHGQAGWLESSGRKSNPLARFEATQTAAGGWQGRIDRLRAEDVLRWAQPWLDDAARAWLLPLQPRGELTGIALVLEPDGALQQATLRVQALQLDSTHGLPAIGPLDGEVQLGPEQGRLKLDSRALRVDTVGVLRAPIALDTLRGALAWHREGAALRLQSDGLELANADLAARFWGSISVPDHGEPTLDLYGRYQRVCIEQAYRYLPVVVIPPDGVAWLDRALRGGHVIGGDFRLRGTAAAFPFDHGEGLFDTRFQVEDGVLDYLPGWPRLERLRATVHFHNRGLRIDADSARLLDAVMERTQVSIADLENVLVMVDGRVQGPGATLWQALRDSPAGQALGDSLPDLRISGQNSLDLNLAIPTDSRPTRVQGRVGLLEGRLGLPAWGLELERLRGEIRFSESTLEGRELRAVLRGEPVRLDLALTGREGQRELRTQVRGRLGLRALAGPAAAPLDDVFSGKSDWQALLVVPSSAARPFTLDLQSDLRGMAVDLPEPLGKSATATLPLHLVLRPGAARLLELALDYGSELRAALELADFTTQPRLTRGELRLGSGAAQLPELPGLVVVADVPRWDWSLSSGRTSASLAVPALLRQLDARIGHLNLAGQHFAAVNLALSRQEQGLRLELDGPDLAGRITVPEQPTPQRPVNAALSRLRLRVADQEAEPSTAPSRSPDPRQWPPLVLTVADLQIDDRSLGRLRLVAVPRVGGLRLSSLDLQSAQQTVTASGEWAWGLGGEPVSTLRATLNSPALGDTLTALGYASAGLAQGATEARLAVEWPGAPTDFALQHLSGELVFQMGPGQLLDIDPGLARMVGLFSVHNLVRRLSLDFSDLFQTGMSFDRISGRFRFHRGQAQTDDLAIEAPAARILIEGRTGLQARDYDQQVTVIPRLGGALPLAGAIAAGPAAGAALFVAERLLKEDIERATRYRYHLTGSWDDPQLQRLTEPGVGMPARQGFSSDN